jgi:deoxyribodipyrimidine photo-lyase
MRSVYWLRRDLRLHDNTALNEFCAKATDGLVVWSPTSSLQSANTLRKSFVYASLDQLRLELQRIGICLVVTSDPASTILPGLLRTHKVETLIFTSEITFDELEEEQTVCDQFEGHVSPHNQTTLILPDDLPFQIPALPAVFTDFRKLVEKDLRVRPVTASKLRPVPAFELNKEVAQVDLSDRQRQWTFHPKIAPGESAGLTRLKEYLWDLDRLKIYKETRNGMMNWDDSSKLSPWLSIGALSPRLVYKEIQNYEQSRTKNESTYWLVFELLWRDYFQFNAQKHGARLFGPRGQLSQNNRDNDLALTFEKWRSGNTGDAFVDANMRELAQTGWMSNRGRQNVASYLAKTLGLPWQWGAAYFEAQLIDYDAASNWGNWAYLAGVGQDPRNRQFNTERQAALYDPEGSYRARWLADTTT